QAGSLSATVPCRLPCSVLMGGIPLLAQSPLKRHAAAERADSSRNGEQARLNESNFAHPGLEAPVPLMPSCTRLREALGAACPVLRSATARWCSRARPRRRSRDRKLPAPPA